MILSFVAIVLTFGLVIFLHESGHFFVCRWIGVRVERFAFGFGPELWGVTRGDTRYSICAIPLGGFVKPAGESPEESEGKPDEYFGKPWTQRLGIVAAGPGMNYLLAWVLFSMLLMARGEPTPNEAAVIGDLAQGFPALEAGLVPGDRVVSIDGRAVDSWDEMAEIIHASPEKEVRLEVRRGGETLRMPITPRKDPNGARGLIGIAPEVTYERVSPPQALVGGARQCWYWTAFTVKTLSAKIVRLEKPDLAGPVGIMQMIGKAAHSGVADFFGLVALISVAVGFFNILPIPLLDGGHAMMFIYEGVTRRKLTSRALSIANSVGLAFLLSLLLFATVQDIARLRNPPWKKKKAAEKPAPSEPVPAVEPSTAPVPSAP